MAVQKPSIPKGTRDFTPVETARRDYIFSTLKEVFRSFGFAAIETPAMENLSTLLGKYGEEGDKLLFKILNSGDFMKGVRPFGDKVVYAHPAEKEECVDIELAINNFNNKPENYSQKITHFISEKGLRYDLTVPFARFVVQHQNEIVFPFKRYQIQPVWRADRPQKGRYREFCQCDVDIIGSRSLVNETELIRIVESLFSKLGVEVVLKLNNRKILAGIAETIGYADRIVDITVAIDKLEKIGLDAVCMELASKGISTAAIELLKPMLRLEGDNIQKLNRLEAIISSTESGVAGIDEMRRIFAYTEALDIKLDIELDLALARGLNYYTGTIFEVKAKDYAIGSICGGGRYDDLTGIFGMPDTSGVGMSFGAERIYDVMLALNLFPDDIEQTTRVLFANFGGDEEIAAMKLLPLLRAKGISCEIYPEAAKIKKQFDYANKRDIPYVIVIGSQELESGCATVKNMLDGTHSPTPFDKLDTLFL